MKKKSKFQGKRYPTYALQFWFDKSGTLNCMEISNTRKKAVFLDHSLDMWIFGEGIANSKMLDNYDKEALEQFCHSYLKTRREQRA